MQRLELQQMDGGSTVLPYVTTGPLPRTILPKLREILMRGSSCSEVLDTIATWELPQLDTVELGYWEESDVTFFQRFGQIHSHLRCLTLCSANYPVKLVDILPYCDVLRSIKIEAEDFPLLDIVDRHSNLEIFIFHSTEWTSPTKEILATFKDFKLAARGLLPKLIDAYLHNIHDKQVASFHGGEDHITVYEDGNVRKRYDDGRISPLCEYSIQLHQSW